MTDRITQAARSRWERGQTMISGRYVHLRWNELKPDIRDALVEEMRLTAADLDASDIAAGLEALNTPIVATWPEVRERLGLGLEPKREEDWSMDDDALKSAFIVWVDYGTEGWSPFGYNTLEDATRAVASGFSHPVVITGPVLFPPAKED